MRKTVLIVLLIAAFCVVLFAFTRSRNSAQNGSAQQDGAAANSRSGGGRGGRGGGQGMGNMTIPVAVSPAVQKDMPIYVSGLGTVEAFYTVVVKPRIDGQVTQVYFKEGQNVKKGELLVQIDPRPYEVALSQAEAQQYKDQTQLTIQKRNFERYSDLFKQGVVSRQDLDAQESSYGALEGTVRADQASVDNAKLNVAYCHVTAPIAGRVGLRQVDPGNFVHSSDPNGLLVITQLHPIAATFTITEDSLPEVMKAEHSQKKPLEVDVFSRDNQTKLASGNLTTINNLVDPTTGTVKLKAVFDNHDELLWPNQFVNARLLLHVQKNALVIPSAAIQRGTQGTFVFVVGQDNTAQIKQVKIGVTDGNLIAVDSGLNVGDQVVTDGQDKLQGGSKVQPHPMAGAPASAGQGRTQVPVGM
jgi:membrane fusion protein, multidrug efflux system